MIFKTKNGKLHCDDGPAIVFEDGSYTWYNDGRFHCEIGPAIFRVKTESQDERMVYYLDGAKLDFTSDDELIKEVMKRKMIEIVET